MESAQALSLEYAGVPAYLGDKGIVQRLLGIGAQHAGMHPPIRAELGVELNQRDYVSTVAEGDGVGAGGILDDGVDVPRPGFQLSLGNGVFLGNDLHTDGEAVPRCPLQALPTAR